MIDLRGKKVLVTGATGGIGTELCKRFIREGCYVIAVSRSLPKLAELYDNGFASDIFPMDLEDQDSMEHNMSRLADKHDVDILINSAGFFELRELHDIGLRDIMKTFTINVFAPFMMAKHFAPAMKQNRWGRIFNIGSSSCYNGVRMSSAYCSSKHALLGMSRSLSEELKKFNIRVCNLSPSSTKTKMGKIPLATQQSYDTFIDPSEVADVCYFLCSFDSEMEVKEILLNRVNVQ